MTTRSRNGVRPTRRWRALLCAVVTVTAGLLLPATSGPASALAVGTPDVRPLVAVGPEVGTSAAQPPTGKVCLSLGLACYRPSDLQAQYDFGPLYAKGYTGAGQTIVIFDAFGSPTIRSDLAAFDKAFQLPAPPAFNIYAPEGKPDYSYTGVPSPVDFHNPTVATKLVWAYETTLDVEWAHAIAPGAAIDLVVTPVAETQGVQGLPNLQHAQRFALANHLGATWSNSWSATEQGFHNAAVIGNLDKLYAEAAASGVTAFFATGDFGVANPNKQGTTFPFATVMYPSSSPHVVAVGGTAVNPPTATISSYRPERVWNDGFGAGGGGYSTVFAEPSYQSTAGIRDPSAARGLPDVSMNAATVSSVLIYESFDPTVPRGWVTISGTSEATPLWAGTAAVLNQADGTLGFLAPRLYQILPKPALDAKAFHDITVGSNSVGGIRGYRATAGWDAASGLGTPDAAGLAAALAQTTP